MAFIHIPTHFEDPLESVFGDLLDLTFPPSRYRLLEEPGPRYIAHRHPPYYPVARREAQYQRQASKKDDDKFTVSLDVRHYRPEEIHLKVEGNSLVVHGRHHREGDNGFETSEFKRIYPLPDDVDQKTLTSKVSNEGILQVEAYRQKALEQKADLVSGALQEHDNKYTITFPIGNYKPEEITVKVNGRRLTIDGRQEIQETGEHGEHIHHKQFHRSFNLPRDSDMDAVHSKVRSDGALEVQIPRNPALMPKERVIAITCEDQEGKDEEDKETVMEQ